MKVFRLGLLGFGSVNRTLVELLQKKDTELRERHGIQWQITGVASRRIGWRVNAAGFDATGLLRASGSDAFAGIQGQEGKRYNDWLDAAPSRRRLRSDLSQRRKRTASHRPYPRRARTRSPRHHGQQRPD